MARKTVLERFTSFTEIRVSGCHVWRGALDRDGYGHINVLGVNEKAHRQSFKLFKGPIPEGLEVLHTCHNTSCVNPEHLITGTQKKNMEMMRAAGRAPVMPDQRGSKNWSAKLTERKVIRIRKLAVYTRQKVIAEKFGICQQLVSLVVRKKLWRHV
jgi:hypothetical protein